MNSFLPSVLANMIMTKLEKETLKPGNLKIREVKIVCEHVGMTEKKIKLFSLIFLFIGTNISFDILMIS